jgi:hypothetical protein
MIDFILGWMDWVIDLSFIVCVWVNFIVCVCVFIIIIRNVYLYSECLFFLPFQYGQVERHGTTSTESQGPFKNLFLLQCL